MNYYLFLLNQVCVLLLCEHLRKPNELKRLLVIVDLSQVFKRLVAEKDLSGVQDVARLTINNKEQLHLGLNFSQHFRFPSISCIYQQNTLH